MICMPVALNKLQAFIAEIGPANAGVILPAIALCLSKTRLVFARRLSRDSVKEGYMVLKKTQQPRLWQ